MEESLQARVIIRDECDETSAINAAIRGDAEAFATLYDRHLDRVYRYVRYWVRTNADAEDLTQQVFLKAWRAISGYRPSSVPFSAWLLVVAHNQVISAFRQAKRIEYIELEPTSQDPWSNPELAAIAEADRQSLRRAILRLKPEQQQVITMRFLGHLDYCDVAAALGKSEGNVRVIQHRALAELRRLLAHEVNI
jgi:RNA polymerase sigma-70 factor (ECF subfamily)